MALFLVFEIGFERINVNRQPALAPEVVECDFIGGHHPLATAAETLR